MSFHDAVYKNVAHRVAETVETCFFRSNQQRHPTNKAGQLAGYGLFLVKPLFLFHLMQIIFAPCECNKNLRVYRISNSDHLNF